jgi:hypothetical protein
MLFVASVLLVLFSIIFGVLFLFISGGLLLVSFVVVAPLLVCGL